METESQQPPTDKVRLVVTDVATGEYFRLSTRSTPDRLIFRRSQQVSNAHELTMSLAEWEKLQDDIGLRPAGSSAHMKIYFIIDEGAHTGAEEVLKLRAALAEAMKRHDEGVAALGKELDEVRGQAPKGETKSGLTEDELDALRERDALITLLLPYVENEETDTPVGLLSMILARNGNDMVVEMSSEEAAAKAYDAYCAAVGGVAFNGDALPKAAEFFADPAKTKQSQAWIAAVNALGFAENGEKSPQTPPADSGTVPEGTGHAPADASQAGPNGEPPGAPKVAGLDQEKKPEPVEFNRAAFVKSLPDDLGKLRGLAAPAGIEGAHSMNKHQLRKALVEYEIGRHAVKPVAPTNTARPDGEQPTGEQSK